MKVEKAGWSVSGEVRLVLLMLISTTPVVFVESITEIDDVEAPRGCTRVRLEHK